MRLKITVLAVRAAMSIIGAQYRDRQAVLAFARGQQAAKAAS